MNIRGNFSLSRALQARLSRNALGMALMAFSGLALTGMHAAIRLVPGDLHPFEMAFIRNAMGLLMLLAWFSRSGLRVLHTRRLGQQSACSYSLFQVILGCEMGG